MRAEITIDNGKEVVFLENTGANLIAEVREHNEGYRIRLVDTKNYLMLNAPSGFLHREDAVEYARMLVTNDIGSHIALSVAGQPTEVSP